MASFWEMAKRVSLTPPSFVCVFYLLYWVRKAPHCEAKGNVSTRTLKKVLSRVARAWETGPSDRKYKALTLHAASVAHRSVK